MSAYASDTPVIGIAYFFITDGGVSDLAETKAALVALSHKPVSVVLVGVGDANMNAMVQLDSDKARLHSGGLQAERDIVQFVRKLPSCYVM